MFTCGLSADTLDIIGSKFSLHPETLHVRYPGLPLCLRKLMVKDCDPLLAQISRNLNRWMHKSLSLAGSLRLISSVISGIVGFWSSAFFLPKKVIRKINSFSSSYLWHGTLDTPHWAKVSWSTISTLKTKRGLGLRSLVS